MTTDATQVAQEDNQWYRAVDEALLCAHIGTAESFPDAKTALHELICWEINVALDPCVSQRARDLVAATTAPLTAQVEALTAEAGRLLAAVDALGLRELVAGWNGENREDGPYEPHPSRLGVTLRTNAGRVYELDAAAEAARAPLASTSEGEG